MMRTCLLLYVFIPFSAATYTLPSLVPSEDGKSLVLLNVTDTSVDLPDMGSGSGRRSKFDFQTDGTGGTPNRTLNPQTSSGGRETAAQGDFPCPTYFIDYVLEYLTAEISDPAYFTVYELAPFLQTRFSGGPGNVAVREHIKTSFTTIGWRVEEDTSYQVTPLGFLPFTNVIATFNPQIPKRLVLACHYDSKFTPSGFLGATDSAVSCAILIDVAKRLNDLLIWAQSPVSIQMIFIDGKEPYVNEAPNEALYGARHLATQWATTLDPLDATKNRLQNIDHFILLSVLGHPETQFERYYTETDNLFTQLLSFEICLALKGLGTRPLPLTTPLFSNTRRDTEVNDDHIPFRQFGLFNVIHLVSYPYPSYRHTLEDTQNQLNWQVIEDLSRILRVYVASFYLTESFNLIYATPESTLVQSEEEALVDLARTNA